MHAENHQSGLSWRRLLPPIILLAGVVAFFALHLDRQLSFATLAEHRQIMLGWVADHAFMAPLAYIGVYILVVAFSLPGGAVMTVSGGFLFGALAGGMYAVLAATIGATALFLLARTSLGDYLLVRAGPVLQRMQAGFIANAWSYMFVLRLIPLFPFFLVNLAPAFLGLPLRIYVIATLFGIMPATFVFSLFGSGLGSMFDSGQSLNLQGVLSPEIMAALIGLALLSMLPVAYK
ncbi:MAG: hypothetical protein CO017_10240, partial [Zetaproteobacteria bacterium CG_4_8_14_3_um_filter_59_5]